MQLCHLAVEWPLCLFHSYIISFILLPFSVSSRLPGPPHSHSPPLHIVLVFLRYPLGSTGMLSRWPGVCSHRVQWFEVIWTQWWWSKCLIFLPQSLSSWSKTLCRINQSTAACLFQWIYNGFSDPQHVGHEQDWAGWRCVCVYFSWFGLCFMGCMLFVNVCLCEEKEWGTSLWLSVCGGGCYLFINFIFYQALRASCSSQIIMLLKRLFFFTWSRKTTLSQSAP